VTTFNYQGKEVTEGSDGLFRSKDGFVYRTDYAQGAMYINLLDKPKYIAFQGNLIELRYLEDGLWHSSDGTIFALTDESASLDTVSRCGIGVLSFSTKFPLTIDCKIHDYMYTSPAFQLFHTREEADTWLESLVDQTAEHSWLSIFAKPFHWIAHVFGGVAWEVDSTR